MISTWFLEPYNKTCLAMIPPTEYGAKYTTSTVAGPETDRIFKISWSFETRIEQMAISLQDSSRTVF